MEFDCDHVNGGRPTVSGKVNSVTAYGETGAIRVILFGAIVDTDALLCDVHDPATCFSLETNKGKCPAEWGTKRGE